MILKYKNIIRSANIKDEGVILSIGDGIVKASGLRNVPAGLFGFWVMGYFLYRGC